MRLSEFEIQCIKDLAQKIYCSQKVYLFGSRVDDTKKGGDIDLMVQTEEKHTVSDKLRFLVKLKDKIGDQKIDLVIHSANAKNPSLICQVALQTGVLL